MKMNCNSCNNEKETHHQELKFKLVVIQKIRNVRIKINRNVNFTFKISTYHQHFLFFVDEHNQLVVLSDHEERQLYRNRYGCQNEEIIKI